MEAVIAIFVFALCAFAAVKALYLVVLLAVMCVSAVMEWIVVPLLAAVWFIVVRPALLLTMFVVTLPLRMARLLVAPMDPGVMPAVASETFPAAGRRCDGQRCRCVNPIHARYCRRCGQGLMGKDFEGVQPRPAIPPLAPAVDGGSLPAGLLAAGVGMTQQAPPRRAYPAQPHRSGHNPLIPLIYG